MIITCPSCSAKFSVPTGAIPPSGRKVRCAKCSHTWHFSPSDAPEPEVTVATPAPVPQMPAAAAAHDDEPIQPIAEWGEGDAPRIEFSAATIKPPPAAANPAPWKAATLVLGIMAFLFGAWVFNDKLSSTPVLSSLYEMAGLTPSDGLLLDKVNVQVLPGRKETSYFVTGRIENKAKNHRIVPVLRISLKDELGNIVHYVNYPGDGLSLEPGKSVPFSAEIKNRSPRVTHADIDLGNTIQLSMRP
jgi:predicted Zn finger-like uncharacterized protein